MATSRTLTDTNQVSRALIAKMLAEGTSSAPIQHWTQGLARLSNALVGGMNLSALRGQEQAKEASDKAEAAASEAEIARLLSVQGPQGMPPGPQASAQNPVAAALAPPAMPQQMASLGGQPNVAADVTTLEPHQTRGVIKGNLSDEPVLSMSVDGQPTPQPQRVAQALAPQMPPPMQPGMPQIPPEIRARINALVANKATRAAGIALQNQYFKPQDPPEALRIVEEMRRNPQAYGFSGPDDPAMREVIQGRLGGRSTSVTVDQRGESEFNKVGGKLAAERFDAYIKAGDDARNVIADLDSLREIGSRITTGKSAEITAALGPYAEMFGVKIDNLPDLQAYKSIVAKMAPRMRPPGSGATSDFDLRQYIEALPGLGKTPEGNEIITNTNKALAEHRLAVSAIAERALAKDLTYSEATKQIRALPDPLELWRKVRGKSPAAASAEATRVIDGKSYFKRNGQWFEGSP